MIYVRPEEQYSGLTPRAPVTPDAPTLSPSMSEIGSAAFGLHNDVVNAVDMMTRPTFKPEPDHNPLDIIKDTPYESDYLDNFVGSRSEAETRSIMSRIDREMKQRQILANGGVSGFLSSMAAGVLSPVGLIPIGGWLAVTAKTARAGQVALAAGEAAASVAGAVALQEGVLQTAQETRTAEESAWAIAGGFVIGGVLGGIAGSLSRKTVDEITSRVGEELYPRVPVSAGAAATDATRGSGELKGTFGVGKALSRLSPGSRTQNSPLRSTRLGSADLIKGNVLAENAEGVPSSYGGSVEAQIGAARGVMADVWDEYTRLYSDYFFGKRVAFPALRSSIYRTLGLNRRMSLREFDEAVSEAALNGDVHVIPQVEAAAKARRQGFVNPLRDEAMVLDPEFKALVEAGSADQSYLTRIWNRVAVKAGWNELKAILADHFAEVQAKTVVRSGEQIAPTIARQEFESMAEEVMGNIMGGHPGRIPMPKELSVGKAGPLKERALASLPTARVLKFVERDIRKIDAAYVRSMSADIAFMRKFGDRNMTKLIGEPGKAGDIQLEANALKVGKSETEAKAIQKAADADIRDMMALRDIVRGTYKLPDSPDGLLHRGIGVLKSLNFLTSLGMMTVSAVSDIGKPIFVHAFTGGRPLAVAFRALTGNLKSLKLAARDVRLSGQALDIITNDRVLSFAELVDDYAANSAFERGLQQGTRAFSFLTLMAPWNTVMKQWAGIVSQTRALKAIEQIATDGKVAAKDIEFLAAGGIERSLASRIQAQFAEHGLKDGSVWVANTAKWTDPEAVRALRALVNNDVDRIIVTPTAGDKPLMAHGDVGSVIAQFQSFAISSVQKTLLSGLAQRDMAVLNGTILMMGLGALSFYLKDHPALGGQGRAETASPAVWASEALDNSGLLGILMNANHAIEKVTDDRIGISALTGEPARRYINVNKLGAFMGPSLGKASDILDVVGSVSNLGRRNADGSVRTMTASDVHKIRKLVPLQNLFYLRKGFDAIENGVVNAFGIPMRRQ